MKRIKLSALALMALMSAATSAAQTIPAPYKNAVGTESGKSVSFTVCWNDSKAIDNLCELVYISDGQSVEDIIATVLKEDDRFYAMNESETGTRVAYGFDTNGDHSRGILLNGTRQPMDVTLGYSSVSSAELANAQPASEYDHWQLNGDDHAWKIYVNGNVAGYSTSVSGGDAIILEYGTRDADKPSAGDVFYLRPADQKGLWLPEKITLDTTDGKRISIPALSTLDDLTAAELYGAKIAVEIMDASGMNTSTAYSASFTWGNPDIMTCNVTVSSPEKAILRPYLNVGKVYNDVTRVYGDDSTIETVVAHPLRGISVAGVEPGGVIEVDNMGVFTFTPVYEPADADFTGYNVEFGDESVVTLYKSVNAIVAHNEGETSFRISSLDGTVTADYTVHVKGPDPTDRPEDFLDGTVWLNEEWFTHTSGSLNYLDTNGDIYYRAYGNQNNNMAFGATSQFGMTYAGKYIIMSKQAWDGGDTRPERSGGRVVVFDAETFKHIGSIEEIGGDGRSCVGVSPDKIYLGTAKGVRVMDLENLTVADADIKGITLSRSGQIGDMVKSGKYVFVSNIGTGLEVIDTETDSHIKTIPSTGIMGVVQSKDGRVWIGCSNTLTPVDPETLEAGTTYSIPGSITCSTYSWRSVNLLASHKTNTLFWGSGTFYRWDLDEVADPSVLKPVYTHSATIDGVNYGGAYGTPGYDDRTDSYLFATSPGFGMLALQNWYHVIDATTGEVKNRTRLRDYYWFPAMPIFPDKYEPEFSIDEINMKPGDRALVMDLREYVDDPDNNNLNIKFAISEAGARAASAADVELDGHTLTITPLDLGTHSFTLTAESNGRVASKEIKVNVAQPTGIDGLGSSEHFVVFNGAGVVVAEFDGKDASEIRDLDLEAGIYLVRGNGRTVKIVK